MLMRKIIGLTGPIAAGKDAVAKILAEQGAYIIDVDHEAHELYPQVADQLQKEFGTTDRKKVGEVVFADKTKLKKLNAIIHPLLKKIVESRTWNVERGMVVINGAVLKEIGLIDLCDEVWVVLAAKERRIERMIGSGLSREQAEARINSQMSDEDYRSIADVVIENNGTLTELNAQIQNLLKI